MPKVFLFGGKATETTWRDTLLPMLKIPYHCQMDTELTDDEREVVSREAAKCDMAILVLESDDTRSLFDAVFTFHDKQRGVCFLTDGKIGGCFEVDYVKKRMLDDGVAVFNSLDDLASILNSFYVPPPAYSPYMVECLIERDGPTEMYLDGERYNFAKNDQGHYVCLVQRNDHRKHLTSMNDFRIYQSEKLPEPEFTDDELDFMAEWRTMDVQSFEAYLNGRLHKFASARLRIRRIAKGKWDALHARDKVPQAFPINMSDDPLPQIDNLLEAVFDEEPATPLDESDTWSDEQWAAWANTWLRLSAERFEKFVVENEAKILNSPDELWDKAKDKWIKLMPEKPWPIEAEDDEA